MYNYIFINHCYFFMFVSFSASPKISSNTDKVCNAIIVYKKKGNEEEYEDDDDNEFKLDLTISVQTEAFACQKKGKDEDMNKMNIIYVFDKLHFKARAGM